MCPDTVPADILANKNIAGVSTGVHWNELETAKGKFDWTKLDPKIKAIADAGKDILLRIGTGGGSSAGSGSVPPEVMTEVGSDTFTFVMGGVGGKAGETITIPTFWNSVFVARKIAMYQAVGAHVNGSTFTAAQRSHIKIMGVAFFNASTDDVNMGTKNAADWTKVGYTTKKMQDAALQIYAAVMKAFPRQYITTAIGPMIGELDKGAALVSSFNGNPENYLLDSIQQSVHKLYPGRAIFQENSMGPAIEAYPSKDGGHWWELQQIHDQGFPIASQMVWFIYGDTTYRANHGTKDDYSALLTKSYKNAHDRGMLYVETYKPDSEHLPDAVAYGASILGK